MVLTHFVLDSELSRSLGSCIERINFWVVLSDSVVARDEIGVIIISNLHKQFLVLSSTISYHLLSIFMSEYECNKKLFILLAFHLNRKQHLLFHKTFLFHFLSTFPPNTFWKMALWQRKDSLNCKTARQKTTLFISEASAACCEDL